MRRYTHIMHRHTPSGLVAQPSGKLTAGWSTKHSARGGKAMSGCREAGPSPSGLPGLRQQQQAAGGGVDVAAYGVDAVAQHPWHGAVHQACTYGAYGDAAEALA